MKTNPMFVARATFCRCGHAEAKHIVKPEPIFGTTLDRYPNNDGNYEPGNCQWRTPKKQAQTRTTTKLTVKKVHQIRKLSSAGTPRRLIARKFGIKTQTVGKVVRNEVWH